MVGLDRFGQGGILARFRRPIEAAAVDDQPAQRIAVAAEEFGCRMHDNVGAELERPAEIGRRQGVVDHQWHAGFMGDGGDGFQVTNHAARIGQAFDEHDLGLVGHRGAKILRIVGIDEIGMPAHFRERMAHLGDRSAIKFVGREDAVAG